VVDSVTKLPTAQRPEPRLATTVVGRDTSPEIAARTQKPKPATSVARKDISRVIVHKPTPPPLLAEAVKNVTSAGRSATSLVPAPNQRVVVMEVMEVMEVTAITAAVVETTALSEAEVEAEVEARRLATLAVVLDTSLVTVCRALSVTTVLDSVTLARTAPSPKGGLATPVVQKDISLATAPTRPRRNDDPACPSSSLLVPYFFSTISCA